MSEQQSLTVSQTAERMNISPGQVRSLIQHKKLKAFDIGLGSRHEWRIELMDIYAFMNRSSTEPKKADLQPLPQVQIEDFQFMGRRAKRVALRKSS